MLAWMYLAQENSAGMPRNVQEHEPVESLYCHPTSGDRCIVRQLSLREVNNKHLGLANVKSKIIVLTPLKQIIIPLLYSDLSLPVICPNNNGVIGKSAR